MSEKFLKKQGQKQENAQAGQKLRENDRLTEEELEQIVGGKSWTLSDGTVIEVPDTVPTPLTEPDAHNGAPDNALTPLRPPPGTPKK